MERVITLPKRIFDSILLKNDIDGDNVENKNLMLISINNSDKCGNPSKPHFNKNYSNVLNLFFDDLELDEYYVELKNDGYVYFSNKMAKKVITFIKRNRNKKICIIHCTAGVSRSGSIGEFISGYFNLSKIDFRNDNPSILPNKLVTEKLKIIL